MIFWGIFVMGVGHVILVASGAKALLSDGSAKGPFFVGIYILAIGAGKYSNARINVEKSLTSPR